MLEREDARIEQILLQARFFKETMKKAIGNHKIREKQAELAKRKNLNKFIERFRDV